MIVYANLYKFLIFVVFIKTNFACTYEKRYDETGTSEHQNVTKTRTVCCKGYVRNTEVHNKVICHPECANCVKGYCLESSKCICNNGYTGHYCAERCAAGKWGRNCLGTCNCLNGAQCDHKTGNCICATGWAGKNCEQNITIERIKATNWVRIDDGQQNNMIVKNLRSDSTKLTESVEHLDNTVVDVKTSKQVEITNNFDLHSNENSPVLENLIEPARQEEQPAQSSFKFNNIYPPLLIGISVVLIVLTIVLMFKIRKSIGVIRKIQQNPTDHLAEELKKKKNSPNQHHYTPRPTQLNVPEVVPTIPLKSEAPKNPTVSNKQSKRELPAVPEDDNTYDTVNFVKNQKRPESSSYVQMTNLQPMPATSPIKEPTNKSFVHTKALIEKSLNAPNKFGPTGSKAKTSPGEQPEQLYQTVNPEPEDVEYELVDINHYSMSK